MNKSKFYEIPLYDGKDSANFTDKYNLAINRIDQILHQQQIQLDRLNARND